MKISLIVPAYNEEKYIAKLLNSVLLQTHLPDEVIICDNGSTDNTVKIAKKYQSILPLKIISESQKGIIPAVEKAWRQATGDLIIKTDADCQLPPSWLHRHLHQYQKNPQLVACGGGYYAADGNQLFKLLTPTICHLNHFCLHLIRGHRVLFGGNLSIKKSALIKINGYQNNPRHLQEDILISSKLAKSGLCYRYFFNLSNYTSTRRFQSFHSAATYILSGISSRFYQEKST